MIPPEDSSDLMTQKIEAASRDAAMQVVERAARTGTHVLVYRNGKTVRLTADEARQELDQKMKSR
jgi:hypothetical protein